MITIEQLKDVKERTEALYRYLDIEGKKIQVEEEQLRTQAAVDYRLSGSEDIGG